MKNKIYELKLKKGIDDLKPIYAFKGNSQGDESQSNLVSDYVASKGWMSFLFDCLLEQKAINRQVEKNKLWNENYIKGLKEIGKFEEEYEISIELVHNPILDESVAFVANKPLKSHKMVFLNLHDIEENDG